MAMNYEELDEQTRKYMLKAFQEEQSSVNPYRSKALSAAGLAVFPRLMADAIKGGTETSLCQALGDALLDRNRGVYAGWRHQNPAAEHPAIGSAFGTHGI